MHGGNCIGNNGIRDKSPSIGDGLDLGIGAKVIGDMKLGNNITYYDWCKRCSDKIIHERQLGSGRCTSTRNITRIGNEYNESKCNYPCI